MQTLAVLLSALSGLGVGAWITALIKARSVENQLKLERDKFHAEQTRLAAHDIIQALRSLADEERKARHDCQQDLAEMRELVDTLNLKIKSLEHTITSMRTQYLKDYMRGT